MSLNPFTLERFLERAKADATAQELEMIIPQGFYPLENGGSLLWTVIDRGGGVRNLNIKYTSSVQTTMHNIPVGALRPALTNSRINNFGSSLYTQHPEFGSQHGLENEVSERHHLRYEQSSSLPIQEPVIESGTERDQTEEETSQSGRRAA
jgi:hypothetical protein